MSEDTQETEGPQLKVGKFSAKETKMILEEIERYLDENELSLEDICPELREEKKTITHPSLWNRLEEQMPMRSRAQIYAHAQRKLTSTSMKKGPWSQEEKESLKTLVSNFGHDWRKFARILNRSTGDCKDAHKILSERKSRGRFTREEDRALIAAIRKVSQVPDSVAVSDMPSRDISWIQVASVLDNQRLPLDYQRRWVTVRVQTDRPEPSAEESRQNEILEEDLNILRYLDEGGFSDETEVIWSDLDKLLGLARNNSGIRWKLMCRKMEFPKGMDFTLRLEQLIEAHGVDISKGWPVPPNPAATAQTRSGSQGLKDPEPESAEEEEQEAVIPSGGEQEEEVTWVKMEEEEEEQPQQEKQQQNEERKESKKERKERKRARKEAKRARRAAEAAAAGGINPEEDEEEKKPPKKKKKRRSSHVEREEE